MTVTPDILAEAREICATVAEGRGPVEARCATHYRDGLYDDDREMEIAQAALRRGMALAEGQM